MHFLLKIVLKASTLVLTRIVKRCSPVILVRSHMRMLRLGVGGSSSFALYQSVTLGVLKNEHSFVSIFVG